MEREGRTVVEPPNPRPGSRHTPPTEKGDNLVALLTSAPALPRHPLVTSVSSSSPPSVVSTLSSSSPPSVVALLSSVPLPGLLPERTIYSSLPVAGLWLPATGRLENEGGRFCFAKERTTKGLGTPRFPQPEWSGGAQPRLRAYWIPPNSLRSFDP